MYHYAGNSPVKYTDPDGRVVVAVPVVLGLIALYAVLKTYNDNSNSFWSNSSSRGIIGDGLSGNADFAKNKKSNSANPSPMPENGAASASPSPAPNGNNDNDDGDDENKGKNKKSSNQSAKDAKPLDTNSEANKFARERGYKDAHDLKESYVGKKNVSKFDIYKNNTTKETFLIDKSGKTIIPID